MKNKPEVKCIKLSNGTHALVLDATTSKELSRNDMRAFEKAAEDNKIHRPVRY